MEKKYRLPKDFAEKWIKDLRSGEFLQGIGSLYDLDYDDKKRFCCLGVCGYTAGVPTMSLEGNGFLYEISDEPFNQFVHGKVPEELIHGDLPVLLAEMNDEHYSFEQISDWIISNVELYENRNQQRE